uniref:hypothetical protein n=1 Tax=Stappia sp. TaxID=1870903 RepID=UPI003BAAD3ED
MKEEDPPKIIPELNAKGERARLFPVLADTSREGRSLSIFLSCLASIRELGQSLLSELGVRVGSRTQIETLTEVVFGSGGGGKKLRPDGLIFVRNGSRSWSAIVEAKIGKNELSVDQIEAYLDIAKQNKIDAVITISNQFAPLPSHHPISIGAISKRKANLFHWSWSYIMTEAQILYDNDEVEDSDQRFLLNEFRRFLTHESAGVKSFDQMPSEWSDLVATVQAGGGLGQTSDEVKSVIGAWHQESRDLSLVLSRQLQCAVKMRVSRAHRSDPVARAKSDAKELCAEKSLKLSLSVPDAAAPIDVVADIKMRSVSVGMRLKAPSDKKTTKARLNWLLRQLQKAEDKEIHVRLFWPGRGPFTQFPLAVLREDPAVADEKPQVAVSSFEVLLVRDCGARFGQRKNFITDLEKLVPLFYSQAGQYLREWQAPAPRLREDKSEPSDVGVKALYEEAEREG